MLLSRTTRLVIGIVTLAAFAAPTIYALTSPVFVRQMLYEARWYLIALVAIALVSNGYRLWLKWHPPALPLPKPRPTHLKLVRNDETLH